MGKEGPSRLPSSALRVSRLQKGTGGEGPGIKETGPGVIEGETEAQRGGLPGLRSHSRGLAGGRERAGSRVCWLLSSVLTCPCLGQASQLPWAGAREGN